MGPLSRMLTGAGSEPRRQSYDGNDWVNSKLPAALKAGWRGVKGLPRVMTRRMRTGNEGGRLSQGAIPSFLRSGPRPLSHLNDESCPSMPDSAVVDPIFELSASPSGARRASPNNHGSVGHTVKRKHPARPQPHPLQIPRQESTESQPYCAQKEVFVKRSTVWWNTNLYHPYKRLTAGMSRRSNDSAWRPANGRPHGFNDLSEYQHQLPSTSAPNFPRGDSPEPPLPDPKLLLPQRRYSIATTVTSTSILVTPTEAYRGRFDTVSIASTVSTEPFPELDVSPVVPALAFTTNPSLTFEAILGQRQTLFGSTEPMHTLSLQPQAETGIDANNPLPRSEALNEHSVQEGRPNLLAPPIQTVRAPSPVPTLLRPHVPFFLNETANPSYEAFKPDVHILEITRVTQNTQDSPRSSPVQLNMAREMHFEHNQEARQHRLTFLTRVARHDTQLVPTTQRDYLCTAHILGRSPDLNTELSEIATQLIGKSATSTEISNTSSIVTGSVRRKPLPSTFLIPPTPTADIFAPEKFPLLDTAARSIDSGLLGLSRPLPLGHTSQNGSVPMIARPRPIGCSDGWVRAEVDPAKELFENNKQKRLQKRKKDMAEWLQGEEKGDKEKGELSAQASRRNGRDCSNTSNLFNLIDFAD